MCSVVLLVGKIVQNRVSEFSETAEGADIVEQKAAAD